MWSRRDFLGVGLRVGAATGLGVALAGCGDNDPQPDGSDGDGSCHPTRGDLEGPFFEPGAPHRVRIADDSEPGERLDLDGVVLDADCTTPLAGVVIEVWQADRTGAYHGPDEQYRLRGIVVSDDQGRFRVETIMPGRYLNGGPGDYRPAHVHFKLNAPGHAELTTQIYFAGDPYLAPQDSCATCGSDDPDRILSLSGSASAGWSGDLSVVLARQS